MVKTNLGILPPHSPPQPATPNPKFHSPTLQSGSLVDEQIDPLPPLKHPLDILCHDAARALNLPLSLGDDVLVLATSLELSHSGGECGIKLSAPIGRGIGDGAGGVLACEEALDLKEVTKG